MEGTTYDLRSTATEHVPGACQSSGSQSYEDIGGYVEVKGGGIDWIVVTTARMKGWKTRTFMERVCYHHRPMGTALVRKLTANFLWQTGLLPWWHPLWQLFRTCYQTVRRPYLFGGWCLLAVTAGAGIRAHRGQSPPQLIRFHQREQDAEIAARPIQSVSALGR